MANVIEIMPDLTGDEQIFVQKLIENMSDDQARMFATAYRARRRDPLLVLLTACLGLIGFAGIQRFILNQIGMGLLYFFTGGLCLIGTIVDMINYRKLAFEYNSREAQQVSIMVK
jgi:TM2 domain-containing membrane protein YozV